MAILNTLTFDDLTEDQSLITQNPANELGGEPWYTVVGTGGSMVAKASAAIHGDRGLQLGSMTGPGQVVWLSDTATTDTHVASMYFRIDAAPSGNCYMMGCSDATGTLEARADWRINDSLQVTVRDGTIASGGTSSQQLSEGVWYRAEWMVGSGGQELRIYEGEATVPYITQIGALSAPLHNRLSHGVIASPNNISLSIDTIRIADDWVGPFGTPNEPLATPTGFDFVAAPDKVEIAASWDPVNGAAAYQVAIELLVGGSWQELNTFSVVGTSRTFGVADGLVGGQTYRGAVRAMPPGA